MHYPVLKREAIFGVVLLLSAFAKCAAPFACLVLNAVRWKNGTVNTVQIFPLSWSELESNIWFFFLLRGRWCSGLFNMLKVTDSESNWLMTIIIDHNKHRCHGDGAVYFMQSMTPCLLPSVILTLPVAVVKRACRSWLDQLPNCVVHNWGVNWQLRYTLMPIKRHEAMTLSRRWSSDARQKNFTCDFSFANSCRQIYIFGAKLIISSHLATMAIGSPPWMCRWVV